MARTDGITWLALQSARADAELVVGQLKALERFYADWQAEGDELHTAMQLNRRTSEEVEPLWVRWGMEWQGALDLMTELERLRQQLQRHFDNE